MTTIQTSKVPLAAGTNNIIKYMDNFFVSKYVSNKIYKSSYIPLDLPARWSITFCSITDSIILAVV